MQTRPADGTMTADTLSRFKKGYVLLHVSINHPRARLPLSPPSPHYYRESPGTSPALRWTQKHSQLLPALQPEHPPILGKMTALAERSRHDHNRPCQCRSAQLSLHSSGQVQGQNGYGCESRDSGAWHGCSGHDLLAGSQRTWQMEHSTSLPVREPANKPVSEGKKVTEV